MSVLHQISGCENTARKADVIFIHGLGGDAFDTWRHGTDHSTSWPHWLGQEFAEVRVWSLGYAASPTKLTRFLGWFSKRWRDAGHSMALPDRALQVLDLMGQRGLGQRPILFICHSLGGLLAKQILRTADDATDLQKKQVATNTRAVLFLATPHAGAELASLVDAFRSVFGATVSIEDLRAHDHHLRDLLNWYRNHAPILGIETVTYYEQRGIKDVLPIVSPTSAHPGVGADPVGLDEDHLSIAKPRERDAQVCGAARVLLCNHVLAPRHAPPSEPQAPPAHAVELDRVLGVLRHASGSALLNLTDPTYNAASMKAIMGADVEDLIDKWSRVEQTKEAEPIRRQYRELATRFAREGNLTASFRDHAKTVISGWHNYFDSRRSV